MTEGFKLQFLDGIPERSGKYESALIQFENSGRQIACIVADSYSSASTITNGFRRTIKAGRYGVLCIKRGLKIYLKKREDQNAAHS